MNAKKPLTLRQTAKKLTEIMMKHFDSFPPEERKRRLSYYIRGIKRQIKNNEKRVAKKATS